MFMVAVPDGTSGRTCELPAAVLVERLIANNTRGFGLVKKVQGTLLGTMGTLSQTIGFRGVVITPHVHGVSLLLLGMIQIRATDVDNRPLGNMPHVSDLSVRMQIIIITAYLIIILGGYLNATVKRRVGEWAHIFRGFDWYHKVVGYGLIGNK